MTTVQHFLSWVKEKSKKNRNFGHHENPFVSTSPLSVESSSVDPSLKTFAKELEAGNCTQESTEELHNTPDLMEMLHQSGMTLPEKQAFVEEVRRRAPYRASMKLPAIPREDRRELMSMKKRQQDSPFHVYEEIPAYALDGEGDTQTKSAIRSDSSSRCYAVQFSHSNANQHCIPTNGKTHFSTAPHSIRTANQRHSLPANNQMKTCLTKEHQEAIEKHRRTVQQYREALPTPVCTEDDTNVLRSDRLYPVTSDSTNYLRETLRTSQHSAFSPFTPRSSEQSSQHLANDNDKHIKSSGSADCETHKDSVTKGNSESGRSVAISHSLNESKCNQAKGLGAHPSYKVRGDGNESDKCDSDNRVIETANEAHVHCKRCHRPHGIYHGALVGHCGSEIDNSFMHSLDDIRSANSLHVKSKACSNSPATTKDIGPDDISATTNKVAPLTRCNSSPAPLNMPLTVSSEISNPTQESTPCQSVAQTLPTTKAGSSRILTNGSLSSSRSTTSTDSSLSPNESCHSAKSRLSMSGSDSGNSSIYTFSGSEKDSTLLRDTKLPRESETIAEQSEAATVESDCSNDTFSEYDMHSGDTSPCVQNDEYTDYLSKVERNHFLKIDVQRVIRESESSECESSAELSTFARFDGRDSSSSLTNVTSMSDLSVLDLEGGVISGQGHNKRMTRSSANRRRVRFARVPSSDDSDAKNSDEFSFGKHGLTKSENRRHVKKKSALKKPMKTELYCLPEFSPSIYDDSRQLSDFDRFERLSCRATSFSPNTTKTSIVTSPATSPTIGLLAPSAALCRRSQNKLLSDLMKRNHDRQLFML